MSASRTSGRLLRLYPPAWRERYGEELQALIVESSGGQPVPWRVRFDVALAGGRERLRAGGLSGDGAPGEQVRGGALLVLVAWALFVVGGVGVQKFSEHWQDVTPAAGRGLPSTAFAALVVTAICASALVLAGIACAIPNLVAFLRGDGWRAIRRRVVAAAVLTGVAIGATVALVLWARGLTPQQRAGHDVAYAVAFVLWALLAIACLLAWTEAAVAVARRLPLQAPTLELEAWLATGVTVAMGVMVAATMVWWVAIADTAPWFLAGRPVGTSASPLAPQLLVSAVLMVLAGLLGIAGSRRALRALPALRDQAAG